LVTYHNETYCLCLDTRQLVPGSLQSLDLPDQWDYQIKHYFFNIQFIFHYGIRSAGSQINYLLFNNQWVINKLLVVLFLLDKLDFDYDMLLIQYTPCPPHPFLKKSKLLNREKQLEYLTIPLKIGPLLLFLLPTIAMLIVNNHGTNRGRNTNHTTFNIKKKSHGTSHDRSTLICKMIDTTTLTQK